MIIKQRDIRLVVCGHQLAPPGSTAASPKSGRSLSCNSNVVKRHRAGEGEEIRTFSKREQKIIFLPVVGTSFEVIGGKQKKRRKMLLGGWLLRIYY